MTSKEKKESMSIEDLLALAKDKKATKEDIEAFEKRCADREKEFAKVSDRIDLDRRYDI